MGLNILVVAVFAALTATVAVAQTTGAATLVGPVTDNSGVVLPGA